MIKLNCFNMMPKSRWYERSNDLLIAFLVSNRSGKRTIRLIIRYYENVINGHVREYQKYPVIEYYNYTGVFCLKIQRSHVSRDYEFWKDIPVKEAKRQILLFLTRCEGNVYL